MEKVAKLVKVVKVEEVVKVVKGSCAAKSLFNNLYRTYNLSQPQVSAHIRRAADCQHTTD